MVTFSRAEIECPLFWTGEVMCFPGPRTLSLEVELLDSSEVVQLLNAMNDTTTPVDVSGTHVDGKYHVFSVSANEPLDDVVSYTATLKRSI